MRADATQTIDNDEPVIVEIGYYAELLGLKRESAQARGSVLPSNASFCTTSRCRREMESERRLNELSVGSVIAKSSALRLRNTSLANIDEERALVSSRHMSHPETSGASSANVLKVHESSSEVAVSLTQPKRRYPKGMRFSVKDKIR